MDRPDGTTQILEASMSISAVWHAMASSATFLLLADATHYRIRHRSPASTADGTPAVNTSEEARSWFRIGDLDRRSTARPFTASRTGWRAPLNGFPTTTSGLNASGTWPVSMSAAPGGRARAAGRD
jgi:hypothetical protein